MFIETFGSAGTIINSSEIVKIQPVAKRGEKPAENYTQYFAVTRDGERFQIAGGDVERLSCEGSMLPARPGDTALVLYIFEDGKHIVKELPIVAWKILPCTLDSCAALPILPDVVDDADPLGILLADGRVMAPFEGTFDDREAFIAHFLRIAERRREKKAVA